MPPTTTGSGLGTLIVDERRYDVTGITLDGGEFVVFARHLLGDGTIDLPTRNQGVLFGPDGVIVNTFGFDLPKPIHAKGTPGDPVQVKLQIRVQLHMSGSSVWPVTA